MAPDPCTTKLYDHTEDLITRAEVERIRLANAGSAYDYAAPFPVNLLTEYLPRSLVDEHPW